MAKSTPYLARIDPFCHSFYCWHQTVTGNVRDLRYDKIGTERANVAKSTPHFPALSRSVYNIMQMAGRLVTFRIPEDLYQGFQERSARDITTISGNYLGL